MPTPERDLPSYLSDPTAARLLFGPEVDVEAVHEQSESLLRLAQRYFGEILANYTEDPIFPYYMLDSYLRNRLILEDMYPKDEKLEEALLRMAIGDASRMTRLANIANKDPKTGTWDRRILDSELNHLIENRNTGNINEKRERPNTEIALIIIDIDNFKALNTELLYEGADAKLIGVASIISSSFRPTDTIAQDREKKITARNSKNADEFFIAMLHLYKEDLSIVPLRLQTLQATIKEELDITISCGFTFVTSKDLSASDVITRANQNLIFAKNNPGKNSIAGDEGIIERN